jgi:hypothetical protein
MSTQSDRVRQSRSPSAPVRPTCGRFRTWAPSTGNLALLRMRVRFLTQQFLPLGGSESRKNEQSIYRRGSSSPGLWIHLAAQAWPLPACDFLGVHGNPKPCASSSSSASSASARASSSTGRGIAAQRALMNTPALLGGAARVRHRRARRDCQGQGPRGSAVVDPRGRLPRTAVVSRVVVVWRRRSMPEARPRVP